MSGSFFDCGNQLVEWKYVRLPHLVVKGRYVAN